MDSPPDAGAVSQLCSEIGSMALPKAPTPIEGHWEENVCIAQPAEEAGMQLSPPQAPSPPWSVGNQFGISYDELLRDFDRDAGSLFYGGAQGSPLGFLDRSSIDDDAAWTMSAAGATSPLPPTLFAESGSPEAAGSVLREGAVAAAFAVGMMSVSPPKDNKGCAADPVEGRLRSSTPMRTAYVRKYTEEVTVVADSPSPEKRVAKCTAEVITIVDSPSPPRMHARASRGGNLEDVKACVKDLADKLQELIDVLRAL